MILDLLLGRHGYSLTPEEETDWCRLYVVLGFLIGGLVVGLAVDLAQQGGALMMSSLTRPEAP